MEVLAQEQQVDSGMPVIVSWLLILAVLAVIPAGVATSKGRDFFPWWLFGLAFFLPALIAVLIVSDLSASEEALVAEGRRRRCPHCAEAIRLEANVCPHCHRDVPAADREVVVRADVVAALRKPRATAPTTERLAAEVGAPVEDVLGVLQDLQGEGRARASRPPLGKHGATYWSIKR